MVLISVDLPQPFGPRIATCSPAPILSVMSWSTCLSPSMTRHGGKLAGRVGLQRFIVGEYTARMRKSGLFLLLVSFCPLAFGQLDSSSITVSASETPLCSRIRRFFGERSSGLATGLDDMLAALRGRGITAANFPSVTTVQVYNCELLDEHDRPRVGIQPSRVPDEHQEHCCELRHPAAKRRQSE